MTKFNDHGITHTTNPLLQFPIESAIWTSMATVGVCRITDPADGQPLDVALIMLRLVSTAGVEYIFPLPLEVARVVAGNMLEHVAKAAS